MTRQRNDSGTMLWQIGTLPALALGILLTLSAGALYGKYSQRWGPPADLTAAAAQLEKMPRQIGDWKLVDESPMHDYEVEMLQCAGYVKRRYVNQQSGKAIDLAIIVGPSGPTSVHTPEICFSSRAYERQSQRQRIVVKSSSSNQHSFWRVDFSTKNALADDLRVYYAWSLGQQWEAADSPRLEFGAEPLLYKLQLAGAIAPGQGDDKRDPGREFLEELLKSGWEMAGSG